MCFVEFEDVSHAARALKDMYGHTLGGLVKGGIRLAYSKNPLGIRNATGGPGSPATPHSPYFASDMFGSLASPTAFGAAAAGVGVGAGNTPTMSATMQQIQEMHLQQMQRQQQQQLQHSQSQSQQQQPQYAGWGSFGHHQPQAQAHTAGRVASPPVQPSFSPFGN